MLKTLADMSAKNVIFLDGSPYIPPFCGFCCGGENGYSGLYIYWMRMSRIPIFNNGILHKIQCMGSTMSTQQGKKVVINRVLTVSFKIYNIIGKLYFYSSLDEIIFLYCRFLD